jgi:hypothetical protein
MALRDFWRAYPFISRLLAVVAGGTGALVGTVQAWPLVEPYLAAHRAYVRDYTGDETSKLKRDFAPVKAGMLDVQISIARTRRSAINDRLITLEIDAPKSESSAELVKRRQQIDQLKDELSNLDDEIKDLRKQREKS